MPFRSPPLPARPPTPPLSRRSLLRGAAVAGAAGLLSAAAGGPMRSPTQTPGPGASTPAPP
ncbi:twin-arginine translocation signal domain-containing protein [Streptomyces sp. NPDC051776]|uniref:twin-arginine translocation signal domain-containing protein n=1 Tax=Streptomyces sp. NPDC051776 TaxID=3155414 RepID=UPI003413F016